MTFEGKFTTKLIDYSVDDATIELKRDTTKNELNQIVKTLLRSKDGLEGRDFEEREFDFIVAGRLLRTSVSDHLELYADEINAEEILNEKLVEIQYTLSVRAPQPLDTVQQNDWISSVDATDDYLITGSYDNSICIYSKKERKNLAIIASAHTKPVTDVNFIKPLGLAQGDSKKSKELLYFISAGHDELASLWTFNPSNLRCQRITTFSGHKRSVDCLDVHQDLLATGSFDKTIKVWSVLPDDLTNGTEITSNGNTNTKRKKAKQESTKATIEKSQHQTSRIATVTLTGHKDGVRGVKWMRQGTGADSLASCSLDGTILLWDVETGNITRTFVSAKPAMGLDHDKNTNLIISSACDRFVRLWDLRAPSESRASAVFSSHTGWVSSVSFCPNDTNQNFVSGGYDNLVKLWDVRSSKACLYDLIGHHDTVFDVSCNNPDIVVSGSADSTMRIFKK